jgi:hypothetical protein
MQTSPLDHVDWFAFKLLCDAEQLLQQLARDED